MEQAIPCAKEAKTTVNFKIWVSLAKNRPVMAVINIKKEKIPAELLSLAKQRQKYRESSRTLLQASQEKRQAWKTIFCTCNPYASQILLA